MHRYKVTYIDDEHEYHESDFDELQEAIGYGFVVNEWSNNNRVYIFEYTRLLYQIYDGLLAWIID